MMEKNERPTSNIQRSTLNRFQNTDFRDATEFITLAQKGPMPKDFGRREGEIPLDEMFISLDLIKASFEKGTVEYKKSMKRFLELRPGD